MSMTVYENTYYRRQHVTGPGCVLVSIKFGVRPKNGVLISKRLELSQEDANIQFDLSRHISEVNEGVQEANIRYGGDLQIQEIEVVPSDYPQQGQTKYAAYQIAEYVLQKTLATENSDI